jgi:hypothetical protein
MQFIPRKLLFKACNRETTLLTRMKSTGCVKGELFRKDHILLQFAGLRDQRQEEICEMGMLLITGKKYVSFLGDANQNGWSLCIPLRPNQYAPGERHPKYRGEDLQLF